MWHAWCAWSWRWFSHHSGPTVLIAAACPIAGPIYGSVGAVYEKRIIFIKTEPAGPGQSPKSQVAQRHGAHATKNHR